MNINPFDWCMDFGDDGVYPFIEDENANITGLGHQDPDEFAAAINRYDEAVGGMILDEDDRFTAEHIAHQWAVLADDGEHLMRARADAPGGIAITTLWGAR